MTAALALRTDASAALQLAARTDDDARLVLADAWESSGRLDVARLWRDELPQRSRTRKRVDKLTADERAQMPEWARRWISIGLSTEPADRALFEAAVSACYRFSGFSPPHIVWCPSPIVAAFAGPIAAQMLYGSGGAVRGAVGGAVDGAVSGAVRDAVGGAVDGAVSGAVGDAVDGAVDGAVSGAVRDAVDGAVRGAVGGAVDGAVGGAAIKTNSKIISDLWWRYMGGQFWVGGWYWGSPSYTSFFLDALRLDIGRDMELRARAYAATASSACWWWPGRDFVLVSERPTTIDLRKDGKLKHAAWSGWEVTT